MSGDFEEFSIFKNESSEDDDQTKDPQDVGGYSLEEKIVSAVWVHERIRNNMSWISLMGNFRARFGTNPPAKRTLRTWERKLFSDGTVRDGLRTGRPCARLMHVPYVKASIAESPNLSLRERAQELGLPRSTLLKILKDDLKMTFVANAEHLPTNTTEKRPFPRRRKTVVTTPTGVWKFRKTEPESLRDPETAQITRLHLPKSDLGKYMEHVSPFSPSAYSSDDSEDRNLQAKSTGSVTTAMRSLYCGYTEQAHSFY